MLVFPPRPEDFKFNEAKSPRLRIVSFSSAVATIVVRGVTKTGLIHDTYETVADRLIQTRIVELTEIPLGVQVETTTDAIQRGVLYFQIHLEFASVPALTLGAGYITTGTPLTWPGGRHNPPTEGRGRIFTESIANPAAGADYSIATPINTLRRPIEFATLLVTSATVANRIVLFTHNNAAAAVLWRSPSIGTQTATQFIAHIAANFGALLTLTALHQFANMPELFLKSLDTFGTTTSGIQVGDQFSVGQFTYEEWLNP